MDRLIIISSKFTAKPILFIMEYLLVGPLFFESSIAHHIFHFNIFDFPKRVRASVARSIAFSK